MRWVSGIRLLALWHSSFEVIEHKVYSFRRVIFELTIIMPKIPTQKNKNRSSSPVQEARKRKRGFNQKERKLQANQKIRSELARIRKEERRPARLRATCAKCNKKINGSMYIGDSSGVTEPEDYSFTKLGSMGGFVRAFFVM
jgi:hypothetical protein